ncbi:MAG TPA: OmpA family protein [Acidiferrobacterales bacterium]|nr:OmpA family protein [Acidiferrobacterales bacterium]
MKLQKTLGTLGLVGFAAMSSQFAVAADSGWYVGANAGQSNAKIDDDRISRGLLGSGFATSSITEDERDTGYKLFGAYKFNPNFALEGGYFDLGKFNFTATTVPAGTLTGTIKLRGVNLDAVGILPFSDNFSAFARLGAQYAEAKDSFTGTGAITVTDPNPSKKETNYKLGIGVQYDLTKSLGLRGEGERYRINDAVGNHGDVYVYSVGLVYMFGGNKPAPRAAAPLPEPVAVGAPAPAAVAEKIIVTADTLFDFDKSVIKPKGQDTLNGLVTKLEANHRVVISTGHTDSTGSDTYNMDLSLRRAEAVKTFLISRGIDGNRIHTTGKGEREPVADNATAEGRALDRRVEIEVMTTPK